jgi:hypothetical protein
MGSALCMMWYTKNSEHGPIGISQGVKGHACRPFPSCGKLTGVGGVSETEFRHASYLSRSCVAARACPAIETSMPTLASGSKGPMAPLMPYLWIFRSYSYPKALILSLT